MARASTRADELARRIQRLDDLEAIRRIKAEYALAADERKECAVNVERTMKLFARASVWDGRPRFGRHVGWHAIREYLLRGYAGIDWSLHSLVETGLDLAADGESARGRWYLLELAHMLNPATREREMVWLAGVYDNEYVREDGGWRIGTLRFDCQKIVGPSGVWPEPPASGKK